MARNRGMGLLIRPMLIVMGMLSVYLFLLWGGTMLTGSNWATVREALLEYWPYLTVFAVGLSVINELR